MTGELLGGADDCFAYMDETYILHTLISTTIRTSLVLSYHCGSVI